MLWYHFIRVISFIYEVLVLSLNKWYIGNTSNHSGKSEKGMRHDSLPKNKTILIHFFSKILPGYENDWDNNI